MTVPSAPVVKGEPVTALVQVESMYSPIFQPSRFFPVLVSFTSFTPPVFRLFVKLTVAAAPAVTVTFCGFAPEQ